MRHTMLSRLMMQLAVLALPLCILLVLLVSRLGQNAPADRQIYFIQLGRSKPGMVMLDIDRNLFARLAWNATIRNLGDWAWSPDGRQIAFRITRNISVDLMAMDA